MRPLQRDDMKPLVQIRKYHIYIYISKSNGPRTLPYGTSSNMV